MDVLSCGIARECSARVRRRSEDSNSSSRNANSSFNPSSTNVSMKPRMRSRMPVLIGSNQVSPRTGDLPAVALLSVSMVWSSSA